MEASTPNRAAAGGVNDVGPRPPLRGKAPTMAIERIAGPLTMQGLQGLPGTSDPLWRTTSVCAVQCRQAGRPGEKQRAAPIHHDPGDAARSGR